MRPHLNKNNQALYNPLVTIITNLFGDDLKKQVDDLTKANMIGLKVQTSGKLRYHTYGRGFRARGRYRQNYAGRGRFCRRTGAFIKLGPGRMLPQTSQRETKVNTIISNLYRLNGGQGHNFASKWMELTSDPQILEIIQPCHIIEFCEIPTQKRWSAVTNLKARYSDQEKATIDDLMPEFLSKGIVSYCEPQVDQILSAIYGTYRL